MIYILSIKSKVMPAYDSPMSAVLKKTSVDTTRQKNHNSFFFVFKKCKAISVLNQSVN